MAKVVVISEAHDYYLIPEDKKNEWWSTAMYDEPPEWADNFIIGVTQVEKVNG